MVQVREAATVMLLRDRSGLPASAAEPVPGPFEVLMLRRNPHSVFSPGASVFPGGAVDEGDARAETLGRVTGLDGRRAAADLGRSSGGLPVRVAAVRECFEEAGVLLARERAGGRQVDPGAPDRALRFAEWRDALNDGSASWAEFMAAEDLVIDARDLAVFAHFLTPVGAPRRYDTWFFVAAAPAGQEGTHDDAEAVSSEWVRPADAIARFERGEIDLIDPTLRSLDVLTRFGSAGAALVAVGAVERDDLGRPAVVGDGFGERVALPGDDGATRPWTIPLVNDPAIRRAVAGGLGVAAAGGGH